MQHWSKRRLRRSVFASVFPLAEITGGVARLLSVRHNQTMWGEGPPKDNLESWRDIQMFIAEYPDDDYWSKWKPMVKGVVSELEARGLAPFFRIGQSMHDIIFSTVDHHRLTSEPRVTLEFLPREQIVRVAYSCANLDFSEPLSEERLAPSLAVSGVLRYLRRLWSETRPDAQIPDGLTDA